MHFFYTGIVVMQLTATHLPAKMVALVAIKPNYPVVAPIFCLSLHWNNETYTVHNSEHIRNLERAVRGKPCGPCIASFYKSCIPHRQ